MFMSLKENLKKNLNRQQFAVATHVNGPAVVMAGAGSGKTHTLISRCAYLVDRGVPPESILLLTFTNAAADEMKQRAASSYDDRCKDINAMTYHSFCKSMLERYKPRLGMDFFTVMDTNAFVDCISYVKNDHPEFKDIKGFPPAAKIAAILSFSLNTKSSIKTILERSNDWSRYRDYHREIQILCDYVQAYCFEHNRLSFDDLLVRMNELLRDNDDICRHIACSYKYIMVDEFQDTNVLQEEMLMHLSAYNKNIVVVGDISQSIYAFRGADVKNIKCFHEKFTECKVFPLTINYRSTQQVLDAANTVMNNVLTESRTRYGDKSPAWDYYNMKSNGKSGNVPIVMSVEDSNAEADFMLDMIDRSHRMGIPYGHIAVLSRFCSGSVALNRLETLLDKESIAYDIFGGIRFLDRQAIRDILAILTVIVNKYDILSWYRILTLYPGIGDKTAVKVAKLCHNENFLLDNEFRGKAVYNELRLLSMSYDTWCNYTSLGDLMDKIKDSYFTLRVRVNETSDASEENKEIARDNIENDRILVDQLIAMSLEYDDLISFYNDITLDVVRPSEEVSADDKVVISTIHSAKGKEWDVVIIADCVESPYVDAKDYYLESDMEDLRLFYVAMTRAKQQLIMLVPDAVIVGNKYCDASRTHHLDGVAPFCEFRSR